MHLLNYYLRSFPVGAPLDKKYNAAIHLEFITRIGQDLDIVLLERQVRQADAAYPWVMRTVDNEPVNSISWMSSITMREGEWIDRLYEVEIRPTFPLGKAQTFAYERYGDQLAKTLAGFVSKDIIRVDFQVVFTGMYNGGYRPRDFS